MYTQMERRVGYLPRERRMEEREARVRVREPVYTQMERRMREVEMSRWLASLNRYTLKRLSFNPSQKVILKGHAMRRIFWGFCRNWFLMSPLHFLSGHSDFGFKFAEIFVFEK